MSPAHEPDVPDTTQPEKQGLQTIDARGSGGPLTPTQVAWVTDVGSVRPNNEDYALATSFTGPADHPFALWVVADGVGGGPRGEEASRLAAETVAEYLSTHRWADAGSGLEAAYSEANRRVYDLAGNGAAATTLVAALVDETDGATTVANVGDSRAYLVARSSAQPITTDHSLVATRVATGEISEADARSAPDRNVVTRAIGSELTVIVDIFGPWQLKPGERLLLTTDGVHGALGGSELARLAAEPPIEEAPAALVAAALEAGSRDNATALVGGLTIGLPSGVSGRRATARHVGRLLDRWHGRGERSSLE